MKHYTTLIKAGALMEDIMADLKRYVTERPKSSSTLRTLGDAYMKEGLLDKALESYNRAMELL